MQQRKRVACLGLGIRSVSRVSRQPSGFAAAIVSLGTCLIMEAARTTKLSTIDDAVPRASS